MFAELASALFWSDKIPMWTPSGRENAQVCLTFQAQIHKHTSPVLRGRLPGFLLQMSRICEMSKEFGFTMTMFLVSAD